MIVWCTVGFVEMTKEECCFNMEQIPTSMGKCYMYFANETNRQNINGEFLGVTLYLNISMRDEPGMFLVLQIPCHFSRTGNKLMFARQSCITTIIHKSL